VNVKNVHVKNSHKTGGLADIARSQAHHRIAQKKLILLLKIIYFIQNNNLHKKGEGFIPA
jgi:hypothetical protein